MKNKIWGLEYTEEYIDGKIFWKTEIRNPFKENGNWKIGLGEKFLTIAREKGVEKFIIKIGQKNILMHVPSEKILKQKVKNQEYEDRPLMFENDSPMRIFYFII